jgi:hypothetical protein
VDSGFIPDRPYFRSALEGQVGNYVPPAERNFFSNVTALDPLPLSSHQTHWIELARLRHEPHPSPIRDVPPLFNIYADRSEGSPRRWRKWSCRRASTTTFPWPRTGVDHAREPRREGLASLRVQANEIDLDEAGLHAGWTPRGWSDASSRLVGFEQLIYLRQPGYGPSYMSARPARSPPGRSLAPGRVENRPFVARDAFAAILASGIVSPS